MDDFSGCSHDIYGKPHGRTLAKLEPVCFQPACEKLALSQVECWSRIIWTHPNCMLFFSSCVLVASLHDIQHTCSGLLMPALWKFWILLIVHVRFKTYQTIIDYNYPIQSGKMTDYSSITEIINFDNHKTQLIIVDTWICLPLKIWNVFLQHSQWDGSRH